MWTNAEKENELLGKEIKIINAGGYTQIQKNKWRSSHLQVKVQSSDTRQQEGPTSFSNHKEVWEQNETINYMNTSMVDYTHQAFTSLVNNKFPVSIKSPNTADGCFKPKPKTQHLGALPGIKDSKAVIGTSIEP